MTSDRTRVATAQMELFALLDANPKEQVIQEYLENKPWLLTIRHQIQPPVVITQLPLGSDHRPDFAYFYRNSGGEVLVLVEIEPPSLEIFTGGADFTADFNHAEQQLQDWSSWAQRNSSTIERSLEPLTDEFTTEVPSFDRIELILVAGRRMQINTEKRRRRWKERLDRLPRDTVIRTYDGYIESMLTAAKPDYLIQCVRYGNQTYRLAHLQVRDA